MCKVKFYGFRSASNRTVNLFSTINLRLFGPGNPTGGKVKIWSLERVSSVGKTIEEVGVDEKEKDEGEQEVYEE